MKTFTEVVEKKVGKLFEEFKSSPQLVSYVTNGVPVAIASYLRMKMLEEPREEVSLKIGDLMKFSLVVTKRGDSTAFTPSFELLEKGKAYILEDSVSFDEQDIEFLIIALTDNEDFIEACREAISGKIFDDNGWKSDEGKKAEKGLVFDEETDVAACVAAEILTIIEILANNKDASSDIEYEVTGLATFKVSPAKDSYNVSAVFDKSFKTHCKSDKLAEKISELDIG